MIPNIIHRTWLGPRKRPELFDEFWQEWERLHPNYEFHTWTEENLFPLQNQDIYDRLGTEWGLAKSCGHSMAAERAIAVQRADMLAYEILYKYGGVYINCDMYPLKTLNDLMLHPAFAGMEDDNFLCNAIMGSTMNNPLFKDLLDSLPKHFEQWAWLGMEKATGPQFFTEIAARHPIVKLPRTDFYPVYHGESGAMSVQEIIEAGKRLNSYACHMWAHRKQKGDSEGFDGESVV